MKKENDMAPLWISVEDRLPEKNGDYFTVSELQKDTPCYPKGTIAIDTTEEFLDGTWYQDGENWEVLY